MAGFFTTRINNRAALLGLVGAIVINVILGANAAGLFPENRTLPVHSYWTGFLVNGAFLILAGIAACFQGANRKDLRGLTVWTLEK